MKAAILRIFVIILFFEWSYAQSIPSALRSPASAPVKTAKNSGPATTQPDNDAAAKPGKAAIVLPFEKAQPVRVPRFENPPVVDGRLNDQVWNKAVVLKDFYQVQPGDNAPPSKQTEVLLGYDSKFLYVAYRAYDEPGKIRATLAKRDAIFDDDYVGLFFDTFNAQHEAYEMSFNPLGIQADGILTEGRGEDFSVDLSLPPGLDSTLRVGWN